jgi:hypothetical protein
MRLKPLAGLFAFTCVALSSAAVPAAELMKPREPGDLAVVVAGAYSPDYIREWLTTKYEERPTVSLLRLNSPRVRS